MTGAFEEGKGSLVAVTELGIFGWVGEWRTTRTQGRIRIRVILLHELRGRVWNVETTTTASLELTLTNTTIQELCGDAIVVHPATNCPQLGLIWGPRTVLLDLGIEG